MTLELIQAIGWYIVIPICVAAVVVAYMFTDKDKE